MLKSSITVSQLNSYVKVLLESDKNISDLWVSGEISNLKVYASSGHIYFSLKDEHSVVRAVMFSRNAQSLEFNPEDGVKVMVRCSVSCYEVSGQYQIYVKTMVPQGVGERYLAFQQLKQRLFKEGLFDDSKKKSIPKYPKKLGVITSATGAVIHDIKKVALKRYPLCEIILYPVEVQGKYAHLKMIDAIEYFCKNHSVDVIIIGRGGGASEDLSEFNDESLARAIYSCTIPVISAVGHETDFTICDFVADKRAATPSAAAEIALPDKENLEYIVDDYVRRLKKAVSVGIESRISNYNFLNKQMYLFAEKCVDKNFNKYRALKEKLDFYKLENILKKGYALICSKKRRINSAKDLHEGSDISIDFFDGRVFCKVINLSVDKDIERVSNNEKEK